MVFLSAKNLSVHPRLHDVNSENPYLLPNYSKFSIYLLTDFPAFSLGPLQSVFYRAVRAQPLKFKYDYFTALIKNLSVTQRKVTAL